MIYEKNEDIIKSKKQIEILNIKLNDKEKEINDIKSKYEQLKLDNDEFRNKIEINKTESDKEINSLKKKLQNNTDLNNIINENLVLKRQIKANESIQEENKKK